MKTAYEMTERKLNKLQRKDIQKNSILCFLYLPMMWLFKAQQKIGRIIMLQRQMFQIEKFQMSGYLD